MPSVEYKDRVVTINGPAGSVGENMAAIQGVLDSIDYDKVVRLAATTWSVNELLYEGIGGVRLKGEGSNACRLNYVPTERGLSAVAFKRRPGGSSTVAYGCGFVGIGISTDDTTSDKTALDLTDTGFFQLEDFRLTSWGGANTDSIGLRTRGRESLWGGRNEIHANIPHYVDCNPNTNNGYLSADHYNLDDTFLECGDKTRTLTQACVLVNPRVNAYQIKWSGSQAWVMRGGHGFYWKQDESSLLIPAYSNGVKLSNVRTEQANSPDLWSVMIDGASGGGRTPRQLVLEDFHAREESNGVFARRVGLVELRGGHYAQAADRTIADVDGGRAMIWNSVWTRPKAYGIAGKVITGSGYVRQRLCEIGASTHPHSAVWDNRDWRA